MNQKNKSQLKKSGFTLIETLVAILILSMTIMGLLTLVSGGVFSVRYARNQIVADNLNQEALEYIRNSRDSAFQQGALWTTWLTTLNADSNGNTVPFGTTSQGCFSGSGCRVDPYTSGSRVFACSGTCPSLVYYPDQSFYGYSTGSYSFASGSPQNTTTYVRTIKITPNPVDTNQITVTASTNWLNGSTVKTVSQSVVMTNWHP